MAQLFENFELNREPRWPRLTRTALLSLFVHAGLFAFVLYAPTVSALWHLRSMITGAEYGDEEYTLGEVRERAVMIGPAEKLHYPPGYFAQGAQVAEEAAAEPTPTPTPTPRPTPRPTPKPTPTPDEQTEVAGADGDKADGELTPEQKAAKEREEREALDKAAQQGGVKLPPKDINPKPFKDLLARWKVEYEKGNLNLKGNIYVTIEADRQEDGTLTNMRTTGRSAGDPTLNTLAKEVVATISASRALVFLEGARRLKLTLTLNQSKLNVIASTEMETPERATTMANVYSLGIVGMRWKKGGTDEGHVWKNTSVAARGKSVVVTFNMPRDTAGSLLAKQVGETKGN